jgi:subtilisin family serine protease
MVAGIRWAVLRGARVINISAGGPGYSRAFQETILWATARGALVVASVGNDGDTPAARVINYPAGYKRVLGVAAQCDGATTPECPRPYGLASFSNRNTSVDLIAPGVRIASSVPLRASDDMLGPGYAYKDGTSMAAPYVAGVAALVQAANGNRLTPYQVLRHLQNTATRIEAGGRTNRTGYGVVDPSRAVTRTVPADDADEVNDDIKWAKAPRPIAPGETIRIDASADRLEDDEDVYAVRARAGDRIQITLAPRTGTIDLYLWGPGARTVRTDAANVRRNLLGFQGGGARVKRMTRVAERSGVHHVNVYARRGRGDYALTITLRRP